MNLKVYLRFKVTLREIHSFTCLFQSAKKCSFHRGISACGTGFIFCAFQVGGGKRESTARKRAGEGLDTLEGRSA